MMEQDKKPPVSAPHHTAATTPAPAAAPIPAAPKAPTPRPGFWAAREYRLAMAVLGVFLALAAGVYVMKVVVKSKESAEPTEVVQASHLESLPQTLQDPPKTSTPEPSPAVPAVKPPQTVAPSPTDVPTIPNLEPPPVVLPKEPSLVLPKEPSLVLQKEPLSTSGDSRFQKVPELGPPPRVLPPEPMGPTVKVPPAIDQPLIIDVPPPIGNDLPVAKNTVISVGDTKPKEEVPTIIKPPDIPFPPPAIEPLLITNPPTTGKDPPAIDTPVLDPPMAKRGPPVIDIELKSPSVVVPKKVEAPANSTDYDEDLHPFKKEDTYRSISKLYYNSDAYAIALQRYNRDHPGQADYVRVPPIWVLEKKYANDVAPNSTRSASFSPPPSADLTPRNDPIYTVGDNGEMLADIAKKTLGNEESWKRIWDLNPQLNPAKTIPGGTRLRLP